MTRGIGEWRMAASRSRAAWRWRRAAEGAVAMLFAC
jgi:hypothetical protein